MRVHPTGIEELDKMLGGGLPSNRAYMIIGPRHCGKRLLALTIQKASLKRSEYCVYVTYGQSFRATLNRYTDFGLDPQEYLNSGLLKITDYYSSDETAPDDLRAQLTPAERKGVVFMTPEDLEDETKRLDYVRFQERSMQRIGKPGVAIIDSLNERLLRTPVDVVLKQFQRFKDRLSVKGGLLSLHLYTPLTGHDLFKTVEIFEYYEENSIEIGMLPNGKRRIRLRIKMPPPVDDSWYKFAIREGKLLIEEMPEKEGIGF